MTKSKNLREHLTIEQKNEIITFHEVNQELSLQKICQIFGRKFGRAIGKTTLHRILKKKVHLKMVPVKFRKKKRLVDQVEREFLDETYERYLK